MYAYEKRKIDDFFKKRSLKWGVLTEEIFTYLAEEGLYTKGDSRSSLYATLCSYMRKNYGAYQTWGVLANALLQTSGGSRTGGKSAFAAEGGMVSNSLGKKTYILAKNNGYALLRLLFEIDYRWKMIIALDVGLKRPKKLLSKGAGYRAAKVLYNAEEGLTYQKLMSTVGYEDSTIREHKKFYYKKTISPLKDISFIAEKDKKYYLSYWVRNTWDELPEYKEEIRDFPYRGSAWLIPDPKQVEDMLIRKKEKLKRKNG